MSSVPDTLNGMCTHTQSHAGHSKSDHVLQEVPSELTVCLKHPLALSSLPPRRSLSHRCTSQPLGRSASRTAHHTHHSDRQVRTGQQMSKGKKYCEKRQLEGVFSHQNASCSCCTSAVAYICHLAQMPVLPPWPPRRQHPPPRSLVTSSTLNAGGSLQEPSCAGCPPFCTFWVID